MMEILKNQKVAYEYRNHQILTGTAVFPDKREFQWTTIKFVDSVSILPLNLETGKFILLRQYRPSIKSWCIEQVAGGIEPELTVLENAKKEVLEEIGYKIENSDICSLGDFYFTPGLMNFKTHFFFAGCSDDKYVGQQLEETEMIKTFEVNEKEFFALIFEGKEIIDPEVITAISLFNRLKKR